MTNPLRTFASLYSTTLLTVLAGGLLTTYLGLKLSAMAVPQIWIGAMMSAYYAGLVAGSKIGHKLIARVGHIRAFVASAGIVTASALGHALVDDLSIWIVLRLLVGLGMMCQYMVLESWLNEQADNSQRGAVFASYMIVSYLALILGQGAISLYPDLGLEPLLLIAICFALCIVPIAITRRIHPAPLVPAPLNVTHYFKKAPQALTTVAIGSMIVGSFYGLAPAYASNLGLDPQQVATFMTATIAAGLLAQWPMGKLSDKMSRSRLIRSNCLLLGVLTLGIAITPYQPTLALVMTFLFGILGFTLYPLATALANSRVEQSERVGLSATILLTFGLGACIGPLIASTLMQWFGNSMLYGFMSACTLVLFAGLNYISARQKAEVPSTDDYIMATGDLVSSPLAAALDPRVDIESVQEQMTPNSDDSADADSQADTDDSTDNNSDEHDGDDDQDSGHDSRDDIDSDSVRDNSSDNSNGFIEAQDFVTEQAPSAEAAQDKAPEAEPGADKTGTLSPKS
ncbi:MFS transporter [Shewanella khirikhana]|uniref:MFS-type transporter YcaD n=1 Tax=Shewanella khirikhana TaxID=1965282 RepID=A0ABM7CYN1_9GAMM|nr:MFS transporter [Shewanella khirikhana]AZQ09214.1 putative MFS-type transporter YcaD [Shewanella khirikhana]